MGIRDIENLTGAPVDEVKLGGCLLLAKPVFSEKKVYICGLCPNRSKDVRDLGKRCVAPKSSVQG